MDDEKKLKLSDTSLWLHNKLSDTDDLWSGITNIAAQLDKETLGNTHDCYNSLQPHVKLKLLLSFLHIPRRNLEEMKDEMEAILQLSMNDDDQWVVTVADALRTYPESGKFNTDLQDPHHTLAETLEDLKKILSETDSSVLLPGECPYMNKNALNQLVGLQPPPIKHFSLKRKPKSAILKAELLHKANEAASQLKKHAMPIAVNARNKKVVNDSAPLKGIPKTLSSSSSSFRPGSAGLKRSTPLNRPFSSHNERGTKLLDISEQPLGFGKRRKKTQATDAQEQGRKDQEAQSATPDYAAALMSPSIQMATSGTPASTSTAPSYVPISFTTVGSTPPSVRDARQNLQQQLSDSLHQQKPVKLPVTTQQQPAQQPAQQQPPPPPPPIQIAEATASAGTGSQPATPAPSSTAPPAAAAASANPSSSAKKGLSLTREQMYAAQEMFRMSNKVTRPEKALILGFMAGSRDNPCPQQGHIVTIQLSENVSESVLKSDGSGQQQLMSVDMFFEMNYLTGEWKKYKKYRPVAQSSHLVP